MEEQLLLYLEYHPLVAWYRRGDISATFASTYKIASPLPIPFTINYLFESKAHVYLPDAIGQLLDGRLLIAEPALKVPQQQVRVYSILTQSTFSKTRPPYLVFFEP